MTTLLALAMSAILVLSQAGCGSGGKDTGESTAPAAAGTQAETAQEAKETAEKGDPFGKYEEPVKMTAMTSIATTASATDYENSLWSAKMRELFNIDIEYVLLAAKRCV